MDMRLQQDKADSHDIFKDLFDQLPKQEKERAAAIIQGFALGIDSAKDKKSSHEKEQK